MRSRKWLSAALTLMVALLVLPQIGAAQTLFHDRIHVLEGKTVEIRL
jgi:hypothetical protein